MAMQRGTISADQDEITRRRSYLNQHNGNSHHTPVEDGYMHHPHHHPIPHQHPNPPLHQSNQSRQPIPIAPRRAPSTGSPPVSQPKARKRQRAPTVLEPPSPVSLPQTGSTSRTNDSPNATAGPSVPPAVLVRDKKPKACANCRRAKLKCMVDEGETDCVRCKSRQDACIFYPRGNDEDWQSTVTTDVYSVADQMGRITNAVTFMLTSLEGQGILPPWPGLSALRAWQGPQRDVEVMQGWRAAEKLREEQGEDPRSSKRPRNPRPHNGVGATEPDDIAMGVLREDGSDNNRGYAAGASSFGEATHGASIYPSQQEHHFMPPQLPSTSEMPPHPHHEHPFPGYLSRNRHSPYNPAPFDYSGVDIPIPALPPIPELPTIPASFPDVRPLISPSISIASNTHLLTPVTQLASSPSLQMESLASSVVGVDEVIAHPLRLDTEGDAVYGSDDNRPDVVTKEIVTAIEAKFLVAYFHSHIAPSLYGYGLELGSFPYHQDGPRRITPFILAVQCFLAAKHLPQLSHLSRRLGDEVLAILLDNPADSWQAPNNRPNGQQRLFAAFSGVGETLVDMYSDPTYDKEYGIGPEEIVATCLVTTYVADDREKIFFLAKCAFTWARGWLDEIGQNPEYKTVAEECGVVPALRKAQESDKARLWLLCYIIEGKELLVGDKGPPIQHNPQKTCNDLLQSLQIASDPLPVAPSPNDILLIFHARLVHLRREWQVDVDLPCPPNTTRSLQARRLITRTNDYLSIWKSDLDSYNIPEEHARQIDMDWLWAKLIINQKGARIILLEGRREARHRGGAADMGIVSLHRSLLGVGMDAAFEFLTRYAAFASAREKPVQLPQNLLDAIPVAVTLLFDALTDDHGTVALSVGPQDVVPLFRHVAASLKYIDSAPCARSSAEIQDYATKLMGMIRA